MKNTYQYLFFIGLLLFIYSLFLEPYTDIELFQEKYMQLSIGQNKEYYNLRDNMLTTKYIFQDIGLFLVLFSSLLFIMRKLGKGFLVTPKSKLLFILLAVFLPIVTSLGYVFDLMQALERGEFPHWADSIGIPLMGVPVIFIALLFWSLFNLIFLYETQIKARKITYDMIKKINIWFKIVSIISLLLVIDSMLLGQYWYGIPGILWIYYYMSLGINRYISKNPTPQTNKSNQETKQ